MSNLIRFSIAISEGLNKKIENAAKQDQRTRNNMINKILTENINKYLKKERGGKK